MLIPLAITAGVAAPFLGFAFYLMQGSIRGGIARAVALGFVIAAAIAGCAWQIDTQIPTAVALFSGLVAVSIALYGRGWGEPKPGAALRLARRLERRQNLALVLCLIGIGALVCAGRELEAFAVAFGLLAFAGTLCVMAVQLASRFSFLLALALVYATVWVMGSLSAAGHWTVASWRTSNLGVALVLAALGWVLRGNPRVRHVLGVPALHIAFATSLLSLVPAGAMDGVRASGCFLIVGLISHLVGAQLQTRWHRLAGFWIGSCGLTGVLLGNLAAGPALWAVPAVGMGLMALAVAVKPRSRIQPASAYLTAQRRASSLHAWGALLPVWFGVSLVLPWVAELKIDSLSRLQAQPLLAAPAVCVVLVGIVGHFRWMRMYEGGLGWVRRLLVLLLLPLLLLAGAVTLTDVHAARALDELRAEEAAAGRSMDWSELRYPAVPAEENMAVPFVQALAWVADTYLPGLRGRTLTEAEADCRSVNWLVTIHQAQEHPDEAAAAIGELAPMFALLEEAGSRVAFDLRSAAPVERPGPPPLDEPVGGLLDRRRMFDALATRAYLRAVDGRHQQATEDLLLGLRLSRAICSRSSGALDFFVAWALESIVARNALLSILDVPGTDARSLRAATDPFLVELDSGRDFHDALLRERARELSLYDLAGSDPGEFSREFGVGNHEGTTAPGIAGLPWVAMIVFAPVRHIPMLSSAREASEVLGAWDLPLHEAFPDLREREASYPWDGSYSTWERHRRHLATRRRDMRAVRIALAAAELRGQSGAWPSEEDLRALFGGTLPEDPFTGEPLRVEVEGELLQVLASEGAPELTRVTLGGSKDE